MSLLLMAARARMNHMATGGGDPHWSQRISLLHFDGANGSTTMTDAVAGRAWTATGAAKLTTTGAKFGGACLMLPGSSGSYITSTETATFWRWLHDGTTAWTIEGWVYPTGSGTRSILDTGGAATLNVGIFIDVNPSNQLDVIIASNSSGSFAARITGGSVPNNQWSYIKVLVDPSAANGKSLKVYVGGVLAGEGAISSPNSANPATTLNIGHFADQNSLYYTGSLDEFRITKGFADYSTAVPSAPFPDGP